MSRIEAYAKLLRIPGLGGLAIPPVIAALTVGIFDVYSLVLLFVIGSFAAIYGFILNDYADVELDGLVPSLRKKPLVEGVIQRKDAVFISVICIFAAFLFIHLLWQGSSLDEYKFAAFLSIGIAGVLGSIYNLYGKQFAGSDFLVAISMAFVFLFGALSFGRPTVLTWIIYVLTFNQTLHMNAIEGGVKDADHDYLMGVNNIALSSGVKVENNALFIPLGFKLFGMGIRFFSLILLFLPFVYFGYSYSVLQIAILGLVSLGVLMFSVKLLSMTHFDRDRIRKYIGIQSFLRYSLVPLMLLYIIGVEYTLVLIILPIVWYMVFTPLVGERLFKPRM